ncbi:hypothetical protein PHAVU_002G195500 [Phaseolus vulgaris]|uniref:Uncharacterized protein n=1 Tax=Phaseolus vulgaris TaxID=3885 RepID=V7CNX2_PHAVU|nr:hypothetical protein PHAVU_002G195500g [Phaseolus vulgaris]ESW30945.1 hypothetical protein PHAVU_002G195500g [Phaseolus vulgaris]
MANGSNDKRGATSSNNSTQHDNHTGNNRHMVAVSTPSVTTTTTIISLPNNPSPTPNHLPHFSGIVQSFNNSEEGKQDFSHAKINSTATGDSFNNLQSGSQSFRKAKISCGEESSKPSRSTLPLKGEHVVHYGTLHSFNNKGKGSQCFNGFKLN